MITITRLDHRKLVPDCQSCGKRVGDYKIIILNDMGQMVSWHERVGTYLCEDCLYVLSEQVRMHAGDK